MASTELTAVKTRFVKDNNHVVVISADKSNTTVMMDKTDYNKQIIYLKPQTHAPSYQK